jgi:hypothetical protein
MAFLDEKLVLEDISRGGSSANGLYLSESRSSPVVIDVRRAEEVWCRSDDSESVDSDEDLVRGRGAIRRCSGCSRVSGSRPLPEGPEKLELEEVRDMPLAP